MRGCGFDLKQAIFNGPQPLIDRDGKIIEICHFGCRQQVVTFHTLYYWLSLFGFDRILLLLKRYLELICCGERDIRGVAKFVADTKVKGIIVGGQEAWKAADDLKKNNIAVVYTNIYNLPVRDDDAYDYLYEAPSKMAQAGVRFAISTGNDGAEVRDLPYHAGLAGSFGLNKDDALRSVTLYPAQILGIDKDYGSIDVGKVANLVVTDGDLLEPRTNVKYLFITGRMIPLTSRHTELFDSYKNRK